MSTRVPGASILIGLTTLGVALTPGLETKGSSISITGQQTAGTGDIIYVLNVTLQNNSSIQSGDSFTIEGLIAITPPNFPLLGDQGSASTAPSSYWNPTIGPVTSMLFPYASNVTWTYSGSNPITTTSNPVSLGQFSVNTAFNLQNSPYMNGAVIDYSYSIDGQSVSTMGTFTMSVMVPEPSALVMLATATGIVFLLSSICRRRRRFRAA